MSVVCTVSLLASTKLDQLVNRRPVRWMRGPGILSGVPVRQRDCAGTEGIQEYACTWESRECCVCTCARDLVSLPVRRTVTWLSVLMVYVGPTYRCCWRQHLVCDSLCEWPCVCPLCMCVCVCGVDAQLTAQ